MRIIDCGSDCVGPDCEGCKNFVPLQLGAVLAEVRADVELALKLSRYVHDVCKDVPHDIGLKLAEIVSEHFS